MINNNNRVKTQQWSQKQFSPKHKIFTEAQSKNIKPGPKKKKNSPKTVFIGGQKRNVGIWMSDFKSLTPSLFAPLLFVRVSLSFCLSMPRCHDCGAPSSTQHLCLLPFHDGSGIYNRRPSPKSRPNDVWLPPPPLLKVLIAFYPHQTDENRHHHHVDRPKLVMPPMHPMRHWGGLQGRQFSRFFFIVV